MGSTEPLVRVIKLSVVGGVGGLDLVPWGLFKNKLLLRDWTFVLQVVGVCSTKRLKTSREQQLRICSSSVGFFQISRFKRGYVGARPLSPV